MAGEGSQWEGRAGEDFSMLANSFWKGGKLGVQDQNK